MSQRYNVEFCLGCSNKMSTQNGENVNYLVLITQQLAIIIRLSCKWKLSFFLTKNLFLIFFYYNFFKFDIIIEYLYCYSKEGSVPQTWV